MDWRHDGRRDGEIIADESVILWRATSSSSVKDGKPFARPTTADFLSKGEPYISVCVADPNWTGEHVVAWMRAGCGIAEIQLGALLEAGFERVEWAEIDKHRECYEPGHAHAYYGAGASPKKQSQRAKARSRLVRPATYVAERQAP